ncbi:MAG TPA: hypothetical protein VK737_05665 [Opitutales bacterium]|nr:hypothetical protein [Opitutales bacterium]
MSAPPPKTPPAPRQPWSMKWIVLAILIYALLQMIYFFISTRGN